MLNLRHKFQCPHFLSDIIDLSFVLGYKDCELRLGDIESQYEEYLMNTESALECSKKVHSLRPSAIGMTWSANSRNCYSEMGSIENNTSDSFGCLSCKTCTFRKYSFKVLYFHTLFRNPDIF